MIKTLSSDKNGHLMIVLINTCANQEVLLCLVELAVCLWVWQDVRGVCGAQGDTSKRGHEEVCCGYLFFLNNFYFFYNISVLAFFK